MGGTTSSIQTRAIVGSSPLACAGAVVVVGARPRRPWAAMPVHHDIIWRP